MKRSLKSSIKSLNILGILLAFLVLCVIMAIASPAFLKQTNLLNILQQISINFTIAIGMTFVILIGGIDLSVGSITALTGMFVAIMMKNWNIPVAPAIIIAVLSASLLGLINGVLISGLDLPPFIVTLGMMELARGMSYTVTAGQPIYTLPAGFLAISGRVRGIPLVALLIMIALFVLAYYVLHFTRIGRYAKQGRLCLRSRRQRVVRQTLRHQRQGHQADRVHVLRLLLRHRGAAADVPPGLGSPDERRGL